MNEQLSSDDPAMLTKTLTELESDDWGDPPSNATRLITTAHRLRHVPIADLSPGDLRLLIGQQVGMRFVLQPALDLLEANPLTGDLYPDDLLAAVIRNGNEFDEATEVQRADLELLVKCTRRAVGVFSRVA